MEIIKKKQETTPEPTKTKQEIHLEQMKRKVNIAALEWYDFVIQEQLKSLMYIDSEYVEIQRRKS